MRKLFMTLWAVLWVLTGMTISGVLYAQEPDEILTLEQIIQKSIDVNIGLTISREDTQSALAVRDIKRSRLLPVLSGGYRYQRNKDETDIPGFGIISPKDEYSYSVTLTQPLFSGFSLINEYKIAELGIDAAKMAETIKQRDIILQAHETYYNLLKARQLESIAQETVHQISAHLQVAQEFYDVGMIPLNDLLQVQVELANSRQDLTRAFNAMEEAASALNLLLRRPVQAPVRVVESQPYIPFEADIDYCLETAQHQRVAIEIAELQLQIAQTEIQIAKKDYYPNVNLQGIYRQIGDRPDATGEAGITDSSNWEISAQATWNFWEWGRTRSNVSEKTSRMKQAKLEKQQLIDDIAFEVKQAYLKVKETEKNIDTAYQAIEQARENFRINQERYQQQLATSTEVLDAQTLLSKTMTSYYTALYDFNISKAVLIRAMGQDQTD